MNLFKPKKQTIPTPKSLTLTENDIVRIWEHMKSKTSQPAFKLTVNPERTPTVFDTKIGGIPYWDNTLEIPKSGNGEKLSLLAQLNMNDFQDNDILPQKGILQFFITANDSYGVDFDDLTNQSFFKVIYHENIDTSFTAETVRDKFITANDVNTECYDLPFRGEYALDVEKITAFMGESDYRFMSLMKNTLIELGFASREETETFSDEVGDDKPNRTLWEILKQMPKERIFFGNRVLGYPYFTQWDIRSYEQYRDYDILLLQLDSDIDNQKIMWGDAGTANFFILSEDLKNKNFGNVVYTWDCC